MSIKSFYVNTILAYPILALVLLVLSVALLGTHASKLEIDASAETLLMENDKDLEFTRVMGKRFHSPNFLVVTFTPDADLLSSDSLNAIDSLSRDLLKVEMIDSITSLLNVPLLQSPTMPIKELIGNIPTLKSKDIDMALAKKELLNSPLYKNSLVSADFKTTAIVLNLKPDSTYAQLLQERNSLRKKEHMSSLTKKEHAELKSINEEFKRYRDSKRIAEHNMIRDVRLAIENHKGGASIFLGGVEMIADDMITYVKSDLKIYGSALLLLIAIVLWIIFRQARWVLIPVAISLLSVAATTGALGLFGWEITVISSNFISLQLIITISIVLHLIVRYRELASIYPSASQHRLVLSTVLSKWKPSFFAIITTITGFASLALSGIEPVINLGWMMSVGIAISLLIAFVLFPALLVILPKKPQYTIFESRYSLTKTLAHIVENYGKITLVGGVIVLLFSLSGASMLIVENSFISYFKKDTQIYKGMEVIDRQLGGTTPLDVVITFKDSEPIVPEGDELIDEDDGFDMFEEEYEESKNNAEYWFAPDKMSIVADIHEYLQGVPQIGKVQSLGTMLAIGRTLNSGRDLDNFQLALLYNEMPEKFRKIVLNPYVNIQNNQVRFNTRVVDSNEKLRRNELILKLQSELKNRFGNRIEEVRLSSLMVLYNNLLQSLFKSQILTLGVVALILGGMFLALFRSTKITLIAMTANIVPVGIIFGVMGWATIPLDIMTITIAAISIGMGVDNTIHYIHRYKHEYFKSGDYIFAMHRSHNSIGHAMYYTSFAVMLGFSMLILSNFIPTIYFGLLTLLAMFMVLIADLLLLPRLIIVFKPFGK